MENRELVCITCPIGCHLSVDVEGGVVKNVAGNQCKRGITYANEECLNPTRMLTTSIKTKNGAMLSVKTQRAIPKKLIRPAVGVIAKADISMPINVGDVVVKNILGTGVDIVATRKVG
jgi:CxxC motif-containing protein